MQASIADLRTKMGEVLKALDRNETVTITYRGKTKAVMYPLPRPEAKDWDPADHPAFGMWADREDMEDVHAYLRKVRRSRFRDV